MQNEDNKVVSPGYVSIHLDGQFCYIRNEFHYSEVYQSVNYSGAHAK